MLWKVLLVGIGLSIVGLAYWLYTPIPDGYSAESTRSMQVVMAVSKLVHALCSVGSYLGFGSFCSVQRRIMEPFVSQMAISDPAIKETDLVFDGITVRMYEPVSRSADTLPGIIFFHSGGWIFGNIALSTGMVQKLCKDTNSVVVSVEYRLAPEWLFPAAFDDCVTATKYFLVNAAQYDVDPHRIAVAGDSAGGNLAAAVALKLRDDKFEPSIKLQVLIYPRLQGLDFNLPSILMNEHAPMIPRRDLAFVVGMYLQGHVDNLEAFLKHEHITTEAQKILDRYVDVSRLPAKYLQGYSRPKPTATNETLWNEIKDKLLNPYFAPLLADKLNNLPITYIFTAEYDPLRDEGILYGHRLKESGVRVEHFNFDIGVHGILSFTSIIPEADEKFNDMSKFIINHI